MTSTKPLALIFGATGLTGQSIANGLLRSNAFRVAVITRSASNPKLDGLRNCGADIRVLDVSFATTAQLEQTFAGVDFVVSALAADVLQVQRPLFAAAKAAGVKRVVPSDMAISIPYGHHTLNDEKLAIREYIRSLDIPHTFIEVGWWMQLTFPYPVGVQEGNPLTHTLDMVFGDGNQKTALTDVQHIGDMVARILLDDRTLNQTVFFHEVEASQNEVWDVAQRVTGLDRSLLTKQVRVPESAFKLQVEQAKAQLDQIPEDKRTFADQMKSVFLQYLFCLWIRGDNTLENAKHMKKLDGRELYPDFKVTTLEEYAQAFYEGPMEVPY